MPYSFTNVMFSLAPKSIVIAENFVLLILLTATTLAMFNFAKPHGPQIIIAQAQANLDGNWGEIYPPSSETRDLVYSESNDAHYFPSGILSSVLLMPFVALANYSEVVISENFPVLVFNLLNGLTLFAIAKTRLNNKQSLITTLIYLVGSNFVYPLYVANSWTLMHSITSFLMLASLYLYLQRKPLMLVSTITSLAFHTRHFAGILYLFFAVDILLNKNLNMERKSASILSLAIPLIPSIMLFMIINDYRFGSPLSTGYDINFIGEYLGNIRSQYGLINLKYLPSNIYYYFINFVPFDGISESFIGNITLDGRGPSLIFTSPVFILSTISNKLNRSNLPIIFPVVLLLGFFLIYFTTGYYSYGPRYIIDLLPLAYILLIDRYKSLSRSALFYILITISIVINTLILLNITSIKHIP